MRGDAIDWDNTRFGEYGDLRMVRDERWKLVLRYPNGPHELFDLLNDPAERSNVYADYPPLVEKYRAALDAFYAEHTVAERSGLRVKDLPMHNDGNEAWRDGRREARGLQVY